MGVVIVSVCMRLIWADPCKNAIRLSRKLNVIWVGTRMNEISTPNKSKVLCCFASNRVSGVCAIDHIRAIFFENSEVESFASRFAAYANAIQALAGIQAANAR